MPKMIGKGLSRREREIIDILHRLGSATAVEVEEAMVDPPSNSAIRSILRILQSKGHIRHEQHGKRYVYLSTVPRNEAARSALSNIIRTFFDGSLNSAVKTFLSEDDADLSVEELDELGRMIASARNEKSRRDVTESVDPGLREN